VEEEARRRSFAVKVNLGPLVMSAGFLAFSIVLLAIAASYPPEARLFPLIVMIIMTALGIIQVLLDISS
jgi:hypothetical protein